jgi:integrase
VLRTWRSGSPAWCITKASAFAKLRRSWDSVAKLAESASKDGPHILRHTAATRMMRSGVDAFAASGFLGMMTPEVYGHHHPKFQESAASATGKRERSTVGRSENLPSDVFIDSLSC